MQISKSRKLYGVSRLPTNGRSLKSLLLVGFAAALPGLVNAGDGSALAGDWSVKWELEEVFPLLPRERVENLRELRGNSPSELYANLAREWEAGKPIVADVESTAYDRSAGVYRRDYVRSRGEDVTALFRVEGAGLVGARCAWSVRLEGRALPAAAESACETPARMELPLGAEVDVIVSVRAPGIDHVLRSRARATQRVMVALGDSYASGEGNPDVPAVYTVPLNEQGRQGTAWPFERDFCDVAGGCESGAAPREPGAVWWDRECHRSLVSWPVMSSLWRALDDGSKHTRHVVLSYACTGALIDDGGFLAQLKSKLVARNQGYTRDGETPQSEPGQNVVYSTKRSQVNAMYDDLCRGQVRRQRLVKVPASKPGKAWVEDCANMIAVDELLISMGGNDLGFGSIAMGVLVASDPRGDSALNRPGLWLVRRLMGAASIDGALGKVRAYAPHYAPGIKALIDAAGANVHNTSVVAYPNPVVSDTSDNLGCTQPGGDVDPDVAGGTRVHPQRARVRDANLILGALLPRMSGNVIRKGWTVELKGREVARLRKVVKAIEDMQMMAFEGASSPTLGVALARFGPADRFDGRRMCDAVLGSDAVALPLYFCESERLNCNVSKAMGGGQWAPRPHTEWRHYLDPDKGPKRVIVNWLNDAMLAGRTWHHQPSFDELVEALAGAVHPTAEAHAAAASEIVKGWKARVHGAPGQAPTQSSPKLK